jgi:mono/diheme cytochrome c family protein
MRYLSLPLFLAIAGCGGDGGAPAEGADEPETAAPAAEEVVAADMELPEGVTAAMVAEGETIFTGEGLCFTCHMQGGVGGPLAPDLTDDTWTNIDGSYESIVQNVIAGVLEPKEFVSPMLPRGGSSISDEQVRAVAAYVWTLSNGD